MVLACLLHNTFIQNSYFLQIHISKSYPYLVFSTLDLTTLERNLFRDIHVELVSVWPVGRCSESGVQFNRWLFHACHSSCLVCCLAVSVNNSLGCLKLLLDLWHWRAGWWQYTGCALDVDTFDFSFRLTTSRLMSGGVRSVKVYIFSRDVGHRQPAIKRQLPLGARSTCFAWHDLFHYCHAYSTTN